MSSSEYSVEERFGRRTEGPLPADVRDYLADSYPHNHDYRVVAGQLRPKLQLWWRARRLKRLYPQPLTSLLDLSCSKGYFVHSAALEPTCQRALGIDVHRPDIDACRSVQAHLAIARARFEVLRLHELAERIDEFGGPFQTVLLVNAYQYLYFGSRRSAEAYKDHDAIFGYARRVCTDRLIFNNRMDFDRLRGLGRRLGMRERLADSYSHGRILEAASKHFDLTRAGRLGRNELWVLDAR
jgi:hypothetical protein